MASAIPTPDHIVVVIEENRAYAEIIGSPSAPFINALAAQGILYSNYSAITHPSQPNYLALFSGSTQSIADNNRHSFTAPTLAGQLREAGYTFIGYAETGSPRRHNPWESFADSKSSGQRFEQFPTDFNKLPTVSFVSPNLQNDMHDGSIANGDRWLQAHLGAYADWAKTHNSLLVVSFDEDSGQQGNRVATIVFGAGLGPIKTGQAVNHYSLLHTIESLYGLPALGEAANAPVLDLAP